MQVHQFFFFFCTIVNVTISDPHEILIDNVFRIALVCDAAELRGLKGHHHRATPLHSLTFSQNIHNQCNVFHNGSQERAFHCGVRVAWASRAVFNRPLISPGLCFSTVDSTRAFNSSADVSFSLACYSMQSLSWEFLLSSTNGILFLIVNS